MRLVLLIILFQCKLCWNVLKGGCSKSFSYGRRIMTIEVPTLVLLGGSRSSQIGLFIFGTMLCMKGLAFFFLISLYVAIDLAISVKKLPGALRDHHRSLSTKTSSSKRLLRCARLHSFLIYQRSLMSELE